MSALVKLAIAEWRQVRAEFDLLLHAAYLRAEEECRGKLLNDRGVRGGIDAMSLFMGTEARAHAYASEELIEHWRTYPRVTFTAFEQQHVRGGRHD